MFSGFSFEDWFQLIHSSRYEYTPEITMRKCYIWNWPYARYYITCTCNKPALFNGLSNSIRRHWWTISGLQEPGSLFCFFKIFIWSSQFIKLNVVPTYTKRNSCFLKEKTIPIWLKFEMGIVQSEIKWYEVQWPNSRRDLKIEIVE